jgi:hypothetical protein
MRTFAPSCPSPLALALGVACAGALAVAPAAGAATVKVPAPAAGDVAVAVAPVSGTAKLKVAKAGVPKGGAVTGGVVKAGGKRLALVAVVRPKSAGKAGPSITAGRAKLGASSAAAAVLGAEPPAALTAAVAPACGSAAKALGHPLRRGAGGPSAGDLATLGKVLAARLCGGDVDAKGAALLGLLGLRAPAPKAAKPSVVNPAPVAAASAPQTAPAPAGGGGTPPAGGGGGTPAPSGGTSQCANGIDDDGDGQVDAQSKGAPLFDPGCSDDKDTTENSEKTSPAQCGRGVMTQGSRIGFAVEVEGRYDDACPKAIVKGIVDTVSPVAWCDNSSWDDGHGNGACSDANGVWTISLAGALKSADAWHGNGLVVKSGTLCSTRAVAISYTKDGSVWERDMTVADPVGACAGPVPPAGAPECSDGIDNDSDGQIDTGNGVADSGPDPGCSSAADADESEQSFPATGCWSYLAADPDDATVAWAYIIPRAFGNSCPTMDSLVVSGAWFHVKSCAGQPYYNGAAAGTCTVKNGDAWITGGTGERIAVALKLDEPVSCDTYTQASMNMRAANVWHNASTEIARFVDDTLTECPSIW